MYILYGASFARILGQQTLSIYISEIWNVLTSEPAGPQSTVTCGGELVQQTS